MIFTRFSEVIKMCSKVTSINCSSGLPLSEGWGVSCPGWFILPPAQDLGQAVSSVNSYCTIILEYLVVRDINIILVKLICFHPTSVWLPLSEGWGGGAGCPGWFILPPAHDLGQTVSSVNSYCTIILEYLVVRDINIISVKRKYLHPMFSLVILVQGMAGKLSRLVYLAPCQGFGSGSVISQFLLHHNLGIFSCKRYKHYLSQTDMFSSNIQFGYPCPRGGGQAVQAGLSCPPPMIWGKQCHQLIPIAP